MAREDALDIFGNDPFGRDYLYGLSTDRDRLGLAPARYLEEGQNISQGTVKRKGYFGEIPTNNDSMMTEFSSAFEVGGRTVQYPLVVPTLTADELNLLRLTGEATPEIQKKAQEFALNRLSRGLDPFATTQELRYPLPQGLNPTPITGEIRETPRSFISGLFSDVLGGALNMPNLQMTGVPALDLFYANRKPLMNLLGVGDVQKTAERISYGEPLTSGAGGLGGTSSLLPETFGAALTVAPFAPKGLKAITQEIRPITNTAQEIAPLIGYHRTTTPFEGEFQNVKNKFGVSFAGDRGFYFSPQINDENAQIFGKHIISAKVNVKNPAPVYQVSFGMDNFKTPRSIIQVDKQWLKENPESIREGGLTMANSIEDVIAGKTFERLGSFKEYEQQVTNAAKNKKLFALIDPEKLYDKQVSLLEQKGYDGFNYVRPESATSSMPSQIVAFRPEQINRMASGQEEDLLKEMESPAFTDPFANTIGSSIR